MIGGFFYQSFVFEYRQLCRYGAGRQPSMISDLGGRVTETQAFAHSYTMYRQPMHDGLGLLRQIFDTRLVVWRGDIHQALEILDSTTVRAIAQQFKNKTQRSRIAAGKLKQRFDAAGTGA